MQLVVQCDRCDFHRTFKVFAKKVPYVSCLLLLAAVCVTGFKQYKHISKHYATYSYKERADWVYKFVACAGEYEKLMLAKYGTPENVTRRVCNDPYLNGLRRGINLREKPNAKTHYSQYFMDSVAPNKTGQQNN